MDEILIGDKTYISSKQAAKLTGYAKDYIGQLCREGRVTARLVGRSWYVLESAIQDHRFGSPNEDDPVEAVTEVPEVTKDTDSTNKLQSTWESPRYEAEVGNDLPSVNLLSDKDNNAEIVNSGGLQDTWQAWFSRISQPEAKEEPEPTEEVVSEANTGMNLNVDENTEPAISDDKESQDVQVPIRTVYDLPPQAIMPKSEDTASVAGIKQAETTNNNKKNAYFYKNIYSTIRVIGFTIALVFIILVATNSGYLDKYLITTKTGQLISGVILYNK